MPSVVSPFTPTYTTETPYITAAEFLATPTALELTDLIEGAEEEVQQQALNDAIARASSWIDEICHQVLACTIDVERGRYRINRRGYVSIPLKYRPVLEIQGISVGLRASQMAPLTSFTDVEIYEHHIEVPILPVNVPSGFGGYCVGDWVMVDVTYVNGYVNTLTSGAIGAGSSNLPLTSVMGVYPGTPLTVSDGISSEQVAASPSYVEGASPVALVTPLSFAHAAGISVTNLPKRVKTAAVLLTSVVLQTRGNDAIVLDSTDSVGHAQGQLGASEESLVMAMDLLENLGRVK